MRIPRTNREIGIYAGLSLLAVVLAVADFAYFDRIEVTHAALAQSGKTQVVEAAQPGAPAECSFDAEKTAIDNYASLVTFDDPVKGDPKSKVTVIEFFEPNCGHCAHLHPVMEQAMKAYGDKARFYFKPLVFWPEISERQVEALYAAAQKGKFFEMMGRQFELQQRGGLSEDQLRAISTEIGLDPNYVSQKIKDGSFDAAIKSQRKLVVEDLKIHSVPTVLINGKFVGSSSRTLECLGQLIDASAK